jgi:hypothetical protein
VSCQRLSHRVGGQAARAGISPQVSRATATRVAAGLVAGVTMSALAATWARRSRKQGGRTGAPVDPRQLPALRGRPGIAPADPTRLQGHCPTCGATPEAKPGQWYRIEDAPYCQACTERSRSDCAPGAAQQADASLVLATPAASPLVRQPSAGPALRLRFSGVYRATPTESVSLASEPLAQPKGNKVRGRILDVALGRGVALNRQPVKISAARGGRALNADAYVVCTRDGEATGLAITPRVVEENGSLCVDDGQWGILHLGSGQTLGAGQWFDTPIEAQGLVEILAQIDWKRDFDAISAVEKADAEKTISAYHEALRNVK